MRFGGERSGLLDNSMGPTLVSPMINLISALALLAIANQKQSTEKPQY